MPIKKPCTCGARSNKRCPLHSSVPRRRTFQRPQQSPELSKVKRWGAHVSVILGVLNVAAALLKVLLHLVKFWWD